MFDRSTFVETLRFADLAILHGKGWRVAVESGQVEGLERSDASNATREYWGAVNASILFWCVTDEDRGAGDGRKRVAVPGKGAEWEELLREDPGLFEAAPLQGEGEGCESERKRDESARNDEGVPRDARLASFGRILGGRREAQGGTGEAILGDLDPPNGRGRLREQIRCECQTGHSQASGRRWVAAQKKFRSGGRLRS